MPRKKTTKKQTTKKTAARKKPAPRKVKPAAKAARKITAPRAVKKKEVKTMAKSKKATAPPAPPEPETVAKALKAVKAKATGSTGWKENKYGVQKFSVSCYNCAWYEPFFGPGFQPRQPIPNGPLPVENDNNNNNNNIDEDAASQFGWCRGDSVEQQNMNALIWGQPNGYIQNTDYLQSPRIMNEVIIRDCTEFWCGMWVRTPNPFAWPPNYIQPPPPWVPNGPGGGSVEEPE